MAIVTPLRKANSKLPVNNYRPIYILPSCSKMFEQLMHLRLTKYLLEHRIIFKYQFNFQSGKSTSMATLIIVSKVVQSIKKKKNGCCVFLD